MQGCGECSRGHSQDFPRAGSQVMCKLMNTKKETFLNFNSKLLEKTISCRSLCKIYKNFQGCLFLDLNVTE